jgi:hypothetical protein
MCAWSLDLIMIDSVHTRHAWHALFLRTFHAHAVDSDFARCDDDDAAAAAAAESVGASERWDGGTRLTSVCVVMHGGVGCGVRVCGTALCCCCQLDVCAAFH